MLASDERYHLWWNNANPIPDRYRLEVTDLLKTSRVNNSLPEAIYVTMPYTDVWGYIGVIGLGKSRVPNDTVLPDIQTDDTGDSFRSFDKNTLTIMLSGRNNPGDQWWWNQRLAVRGQVCPPEGCPDPVDVIVERVGSVRSVSTCPSRSCII